MIGSNLDMMAGAGCTNALISLVLFAISVATCASHAQIRIAETEPSELEVTMQLVARIHPAPHAGFSSTENFIAEVRMCQNCRH